MTVQGKYILLQPIKPKDTTEGGLYVPNGVGDTKNVAMVVGLGADVSTGIRIEDRVIFSTGKAFQHGGVDYVVCEEKEILVVL